MSDAQKVTVSVVCCTHNREAFVRRHFAAVGQRLPLRTELIYALDHCTDGTRSFLEEAAAGDPRIKVFENTSPPGLFNCRNFAIDHTNGQYIHYLDDDDSVSADFYERLDELVAASDDADFIITDLVVNVEGQTAQRKQILDRDHIASKSRGMHELVEGDLFEAIFKGYLYFNSANALIHRRVFTRQRFSTEIKKTADWLFYLEVALNARFKAIYVPGIFAVYYVHPSSMSIAGDKSYWNMRVFERLHAVVQANHSMRAEVSRAYGRALFDAGYAERQKSRQQAVSYYYKAAWHGLLWPAFKASLKLLLPSWLVRRGTAPGGH
ncbi:MAG: glycosyltransferase [Rhodoferax sp.]|nr:glycosyltransferase [Rhodoferax sp.]